MNTAIRCLDEECIRIDRSHLHDSKLKFPKELSISADGKPTGMRRNRKMRKRRFVNFGCVVSESLCRFRVLSFRRDINQYSTVTLTNRHLSNK